MPFGLQLRWGLLPFFLALAVALGVLSGPRFSWSKQRLSDLGRPLSSFVELQRKWVDDTKVGLALV